MHHLRWVMENSVLSFILGVLSSLFVWWIITHFFSPKIYFNEKILTGLDSKHGEKKQTYLAKFWNANSRVIIDIDVFAYIEIKNRELDEAGQNLYLDTSVNKIPKISGRTSTGISIDFSKLHQAFDSHMYASDSSELELLRKAMSDSRFVGFYIVIFGFDEFSGARKMFTSKAYGFDSFQI